MMNCTRNTRVNLNHSSPTRNTRVNPNPSLTRVRVRVRNARVNPNPSPTRNISAQPASAAVSLLDYLKKFLGEF